MARWTAKQRVYVDANGKVVPEDSPKAARLLVGEGGTLPEAEAKRLGLLDDEPDTKSQDKPAETKAVHHAPEDKGTSGPRARER